MKLEKLWYESFPYLFVALGTATLISDGSLLLKASGLLLWASALTIIALRWLGRRELQSSFADPRGLERLLAHDPFHHLDNEL